MNAKSTLAILGLVLSGLPDAWGQTAKEPAISEFLADNKSGVRDGDGLATDWIEISNPTNSTISLLGYSLSDEEAQPKKWTFPQKDLAPSSSILIFASGLNRPDRSGNFHTNFRLAKDKGFLGLYNRTGQLVSSYGPKYPEQRSDVSFGTSPVIRPRLLINSGASCKWFLPKSAADAAEWFKPEFSDAAWNVGKIGLGADPQDSWRGMVETDLSAVAVGAPSLYVRLPFEVEDPTAVAELRLKLRIDDGFVAYLNGKRVAASLAPASLQWNSAAQGERPDPLVSVEVPFELTSERSQLRKGTNILALHVLNAPGSKDFFVSPVLEILPVAGGLSIGYLKPPTPAQPNGPSFLGFVKDTKFQVDHSVRTKPFDLEITSETPDAIIRYTSDANGPPPSESSGFRYSGPISISKTTVLRAIATKEGYIPTNVDAQTYIFPADVKTQKEMDPRVVTHATYGPLMEKAIGESFPVVSLLVDRERFFGPGGIHTQVQQSGRNAEIPVHVEYFSPSDPLDSFRVSAGIRIHGGNARTHPKKPLRLLFREEYGLDRLRHKLYPGSPVETFDELLLRSGGHDGWALANTFGTNPSDLPPHGTFLRDQFLRLTEHEMGILSPRGKYVTVYINGTFWGVYDLHERAAAAFFRDHLGGEESDYDVLHHPAFFGESFTLFDGTAEAWNAMQKLSANSVTSPEEFNALKPYLNFENLSDHLITRMWGGDYDWLSPVFRNGLDVAVFSSKNWYSGRKSRNGTGPFHFFCWDAEMSMGAHLLGTAQRVVNFDLTRIDDPGTPAGPYAALRNYEEFQRIFGDRVQEHFFGNGVFTVDRATKRLEGLIKQLELPIIAESARWGHPLPTPSLPQLNFLFTRDDNWLPEVNWMKSTFIPQRHAEMIKQFQTRGTFPRTVAPTMTKVGGAVPAGFTLDLLVPEGSGKIYYTTDGSDPALYDKVSQEVWLNEKADAEVHVPTLQLGSAWQWKLPQGPPVPTIWKKGKTGIGFEIGDQTFKNVISLDVAKDMAEKNTSIFIRIAFNLQLQNVQENLDRILLRMKYDDGFVAYINNTRVASANAPDPGEFPFIPLNWQSEATVARTSDFDALQYENFDITQFKNAFRSGNNVLAIHGLNAADSSDFLISPRIEAQRILAPAKPSTSAQGYSNGITLTKSGTIKARLFSKTGEWSALTEAHFTVGVGKTSPGDLAVTELCYKPSQPNAKEALVSSERDHYEFLELTNTTNRELDLTGARFTQGIDFTFPEMNLAPGAQLLVVNRETAFRARYGNDPKLRIAGEFAFNTKLSDSGETITLLSAQNDVLLSFRYSDESPWPAKADTGGRSLIYHPTDKPDPKDPAQWSVSLDPGGYPGSEGISLYSEWRLRYFGSEPDSIAAAKEDPDKDGWNNLQEYAFGTHPLRADSFVNWSEFSPGKDALILHLRRRPETKDLKFGLETATDLRSWKKQDLPSDAPRAFEQSGHERVSIPMADRTARYARITVQTQP